MNADDGTEMMGIIRDPGYGMRDFRGKPGLWFTVYTHGCGASLQCFFGEDAERIFGDGNIYDVAHLDGKPCLMRREGAMMGFVRILNI